MSPLIDAELERVDRRHAQLTRLRYVAGGGGGGAREGSSLFIQVLTAIQYLQEESRDFDGDKKKLTHVSAKILLPQKQSCRSTFFFAVPDLIFQNLEKKTPQNYRNLMLEQRMDYNLSTIADPECE